MATYLGLPLELQYDRELRYCMKHKEVPLHLTDCASLNGEERRAWTEQLVEDNVCTKEVLGWFIMGASINVNPRLYSLLQLYFVKKKDAREYARLNYSGVLYEVQICRTYGSVKR